MQVGNSSDKGDVKTKASANRKVGIDGKEPVIVPDGFNPILSDRSWFTVDGRRINRKGEITKLPQTVVLKAEIIERTRELHSRYPWLSAVPKLEEAERISNGYPDLTFGLNLDVELCHPLTFMEKQFVTALEKEREYRKKAEELCKRKGYRLYPVKLTDDENSLRVCLKVLSRDRVEIEKKEIAYGMARRIYREVIGDIDKALAINDEFRSWLYKTIKRLEDLGVPDDIEKTYTAFRQSFDETYLFAAPYDFNSFLIYMEINREESKKFYKPRYKQFRGIVRDLQALYDGELMGYGLSLPQGTGKTTIGLFFLAWVMGRDPGECNFATSYTDRIVESLYNRLKEIICSPEYTYSDIFPNVQIAKESIMNRTIDFNSVKANPTLTCRSIWGSVVGVARYTNIGYADDMVSGFEESLNKEVMEKLWGTFVSQFLGRRKENGRVLLIGTRWSVYDPIGRLSDEFKDDPNWKFVAIPALDFATDESNFEFEHDVGFSTEYYHRLRKTMDKDLWEVLYQQQSINKEGLVFPEDSLRYYSSLPNSKPDAVLAVCDSKGSGSDYVALAVMYLYGNDVYIEDVIFDDRLPSITMPRVANILINHNVSRCDIESNSGGEFFALNVEQLLKNANGVTSIVTFFTSQNKRIKIVTESDYIKRNFFFKNSENMNSEYRLFMNNVTNYLANGKVKHDDAPDCLSMGSDMVKGMRAGEVQIINRARLPF